MSATAVLAAAPGAGPVLAPPAADLAARRVVEQARAIAHTRALLSEVSALLTMDHPNVVKVRDGGRAICMWYFSGGYSVLTWGVETFRK
jgi:hypothetical protein